MRARPNKERAKERKRHVYARTHARMHACYKLCKRSGQRDASLLSSGAASAIGAQRPAGAHDPAPLIRGCARGRFVDLTDLIV
ncbi:hypothetical protein EVAR_55931_1 [Eumeta japonica]|uniref:Uncharacterized protein n=1 Tax=Eumeta variegata TaxID=151549 RepID=A0A4C1YYU2_EUMVA|nr:hypothetical protein EVAR_55931_1 [Eumeta japonica]